MDQDRFQNIVAEKVCDRSRVSLEDERYFMLYQREVVSEGRNRWKEMKMRGGDVNPV